VIFQWFSKEPQPCEASTTIAKAMAWQGGKPTSRPTMFYIAPAYLLRYRSA
jgi:hypothetical protein